MEFFNLFSKKSTYEYVRGIVDYGSQKKNGGHDHRFNKGNDRTPAQKAGDQKLGKIKSD